MPKAIAYFVAGGIGDGVMALPAIKKIKKSFPGARLDIYAEPAIYKFISSFLPDYTVKCFYRSRIFLYFLRSFLKKYDVSFTSVIAVYNIYIEIASWLLSKMPYGFRYAHESVRDRLYRDSIAIEETTHDTAQNMRLVASKMGLNITEGDYIFEKEHKESPSNTELEVLIHPGIKRGYENRSWPAENYKALIDRLKENGYIVKIILGPDDKKLQSLFSRAGKYDILFSPKPAELTEELKRSFMFIGNDSGPAHIADYVGTPTIVLFGPADPRRTAPNGERTTVIYKAKACSPCHYKSIECKKNICMTDITVEDVWEKVKYIESKTGVKI